MNTIAPTTVKTRARVLGALAIAFFLPCFLLFRTLAFDDFVSRQWLVPAYIAYCLSFILWLHFLAFHLHLDLKASGRKGLSKRSPKYLDYAVTLLLTVGVLQISFADEWLARHIDRLAGSKTELIDKIRSQALRHLSDDCGKSSYFTQAYCARLLQTSRAPDLATFTQTQLFQDSAFLDHTIAVYGGPPGGVLYAKSPIRDYVTRYRAVLEYESSKGGGTERGAWSWLTLLLLPAVIGLRSLKTSLELFADLS